MLASSRRLADREKVEVGLAFVPLTIPRFHPHDDLGEPGCWTSDAAIIDLIDSGYTDAVSHDGSISHGIFPNAARRISEQAYEDECEEVR